MGRHENSRLRAVYTEFCQPFYKRYRKFLVAAAGAAFVTIQSVYTDGITAQEWWTVAAAAATAAGVWRVPNATNKKVIKNDVEVQ